MNSIFNFLNIDDLFILKETLKNEFICYYDEIQYNNLDWDEDHALDMVLNDIVGETCKTKNYINDYLEEFNYSKKLNDKLKLLFSNGSIPNNEFSKIFILLEKQWVDEIIEFYNIRKISYEYVQKIKRSDDWSILININKSYYLEYSNELKKQGVCTFLSDQDLRDYIIVEKFNFYDKILKKYGLGKDVKYNLEISEYLDDELMKEIDLNNKK